MNEMLLIRLRDCAESTAAGVIDCGFPRAMQQLAAMGYVVKTGAGYQISKHGREYLDSDEGKAALGKL